VTITIEQMKRVVEAALMTSSEPINIKGLQEFVSWLGSMYIGYDGAVFAWIYNFITCRILKVCD